MFKTAAEQGLCRGVDGGVEPPSAGAALTSPQLREDGDPVRSREGGRRADFNTDRDEQALRLDRVLVTHPPDFAAKDDAVAGVIGGRHEPTAFPEWSDRCRR